MGGRAIMDRWILPFRGEGRARGVLHGGWAVHELSLTTGWEHARKHRHWTHAGPPGLSSGPSTVYGTRGLRHLPFNGAAQPAGKLKVCGRRRHAVAA